MNVKKLAIIALSLACSLCLVVGCGEKEETEKAQGIKGALGFTEAPDAEDNQEKESGLSTVFSIITSDDPVQATEDLVKSGIQAELTDLVFSQGWLDDVLKDIPMSELKKYGIDSAAHLQDYLANLDYEIGDVDFNGNSASIDIRVNGKTITLGVELVNGEWQLSDSSKAEILNLLIAG